MEPPMMGQYYMHEDDGVYHCRSCDAALFDSESKFYSGSGYPSFDDAKDGAIRVSDGDNRGQDLFCAQCDTFLGVRIKGEQFTAKDYRYDLNSSALRFRPRKK